MHTLASGGAAKRRARRSSKRNAREALRAHCGGRLPQRRALALGGSAPRGALRGAAAGQSAAERHPPRGELAATHNGMRMSEPNCSNGAAGRAHARVRWPAACCPGRRAAGLGAGRTSQKKEWTSRCQGIGCLRAFAAGAPLGGVLVPCGRMPWGSALSCQQVAWRHGHRSDRSPLCNEQGGEQRGDLSAALQHSLLHHCCCCSAQQRAATRARSNCTQCPAARQPCVLPPPCDARTGHPLLLALPKSAAPCRGRC